MFGTARTANSNPDTKSILKPLPMLFGTSSTPRHSCEPPLGDRPAQCCANHLFRAARPAAVLPGLLDRDRQVVSALVVPSRGARWASSHPVAAYLPLHLDVVQNPELSRR